MPFDLRDAVRHLADRYDAAASGGRPAPAQLFHYDEAGGSGRQLAASPGQPAAEHLRTVQASWRGRRALARSHYLGMARTIPSASSQTQALTAVHIVERDGHAVELLRVPGNPSRDRIRSTQDGEQLDDEVLDSLVEALRATGSYEEPAAAPAPQTGRSPLARTIQELADRYDRIEGWDRPPVLYTLDSALQAGATVVGRDAEEHPVEPLKRVLADPAGRAAIGAAHLLCLASEAWTYPAGVLEQARRALADDPGLDVLATFGRPSERTDRVELSMLTVGTRDGRLASLERPRLPDPAQGGYVSSESGARLSGRIPDAIAAALGATDAAATALQAPKADRIRDTPDVLQQVLTPALSASYLDGFSQLEGYVVRAADVLDAGTVYEVIEAFGYGSVAGVFSPGGAYVDVIRFTAAPLSRIATSYGATDPGAATAEAPIVDRPPFRGNGFTASERLIVPQWRLARTRVAPGTELYRIHGDDREELLGVYRDVATGWAGPAVSAGAADALPAHLVGTRVRWNGDVYLADVLADGTVALAFLGESPPAGFQRTGTRLGRRVVERGEVEAVDAVVTRCRWRGHPFEITGQFGEQCRLTYAGGNSFTAEALQLQFLHPGVYEATAPRSELTDVSGVLLELPAPAPSAQAPGPSAPHETAVPAEWAGFADALQHTLQDLQRETYVIIRWTKANVFVQYREDGAELHAEAVCDEFAPDDRALTLAQVGEMTELGWTPPTVSPAGRLNWYIDLTRPADAADFRRVAAAGVHALRIRGVPAPEELVYRAWHDREPGNPAVSLPGLGIPHE